MIADHDRSYYFGASDTDKIIGNWKTKTWEKWWMQKLGINRDHFDNEFTKAGTNWEHRILDSLNLPNLEKDKQIIIEDLRLRVNLDGNTPVCIKEVKTYQWEKGWKKTPQKYIDQVQVQMFASGIGCADIVAYGLQPEDYKNYLNPESLVIGKGYTEPALLDDNSGIAVQFERVGYFFKDPDTTPDHFVFNKTTALKDSFKF
jgi:hypothetical protein